VFGFLFGTAVLVAAFVFDLPGLVTALIVVAFGGWAVFAIRDRRRRSN
jgi:hypothetical protein